MDYGIGQAYLLSRVYPSCYLESEIDSERE